MKKNVSKLLLNSTLAAGVALSVACTKDTSHEDNLKKKIDEINKNLENERQKSAKLEKEKINAAKDAQDRSRELEIANQAIEEIKAANDEKISQIQDERKRERAALDNELLQLESDRKILDEQKQALATEMKASKAEMESISQKVLTAQADLQKAEQAKRAAEKEAANLKDSASDKLASATAKLGQQTAALAEAQEQLREAKSRNEEAKQRLADVEAREQKLQQATNVLKELFQKIKSDEALDNLLNKGGEFSFLVTIMGEATYNSIEEVRGKLKDLNTLKSYDNSSEFSPSAHLIKKVRVANKEIDAKKKSGDFIFSSKKNESARVFDKLLIKASASEIVQLRNLVNSTTNKRQNLLMIVRPIENVRVQMVMELALKQRLDDSTSSKKMRITLEPTTSKNLLNIDELDLKNPTSYVLNNPEKCSVIDHKCFEEILDNDLLNPKTKQQLATLFQGSIDQVTSSITNLENGERIPGFLEDLIPSWGAKRKIMNEDGQVVIVNEADLHDKVVTTPFVESVAIRYHVSMVEKLPMNGLVYIDTVQHKRQLVANGFNIKDGEKSMLLKLPAKASSSGTYVNYEAHAKQKIQKRTSTSKMSTKKAIIQGMMSLYSLQERILETLQRK